MNGRKVLVVDDHKLNVKLLTDILEDEDFIVYSTDNGLSVLEMTLKFLPDVILLDIMMPGLDGFEVCKLLKENDEVNDIPIIMVTAKAEGIDVKKALEYGAFDYIKKPIDEIEVIARIQSALRFKQSQDLLKELAMKDRLTGLYNHALLVELFEKELAKQQRNDGDIAFVMIDVDHFKRINDTYGHTSGNIVLKELANILKNSVRRGDIVSRYGGEEFSLVLPEIDKQGTWQMCERIRKKIEGLSFNTDGKESIHITVSMGIFHKSSKDNMTGSEIIQKSDEKLYQAKANGRNRVEMN
ncbi:diguanylate cyclase [Desulfosporosinus nitroreducens]|uniref:Stage 0 sporulation protein A homolog n=1 Tax=Desulfosporosinus nitroreducens TaxID=2018668 RepID=A0ABT8QKQ5_9FIRM|nr:diguanylate cyclase [Desulfosporosinus nitroreducens]MDO0821932.1 diguanylate cyclase [Desulfosporosinus nitroreducens]